MEYQKWKEDFEKKVKDLLRFYLTNINKKSKMRLELNYNKDVDSLTFFEITEKEI